MKIQASNEPEQSAMKKHPWMLPPKAIPRLQIPTARSTKVNEDLTVSLVRRMKLNFTFACIEGFNGEGVDELSVKFFISNLFHNRQVFPRPLKVPYDDIHVHILSPFKKTTIDEDKEMFVLADGCFYFRDKRLIFEQFLEGLRNYLLKYLSTYTTSGYGSTFQVTLTLPPEEDPNQMMAALSKIPQPAEPPTLIIKGLPQWVAEQPASMRIFFETFGVLRAFDVAHGQVSLQFENCYKALRLLLLLFVTEECCTR
ncbi:unnamed protein product [Cuscuta epithymum]|uniref:Uncharacterized protein n=1 Tax=Cuscuta epithymum TaxID=186058 RepID=A0AAV0CNY4_9ASTE|nr:unnamed protein product [Cuscuta epithymum]